MEERTHLTSTKKLTVRAKPRKSECVGIRLAIDQQQVGLNVTFTVTSPIAAQVMVAISGIEWLVGRQRYKDWLKLTIERDPVLALGFAFFSRV